MRQPGGTSDDPSPSATALAVVIVAYRSGGELQACVDGALAAVAQPADIVVVSNDPTDRNAARVAREAGIALIQNDRNVGFCEAVNQGLSATESEHVLFLNQDARVEPGFVERLVDHLDRDPSLASVGGRLLRGSPKAPHIDSTGIAIWRGRRPVDLRHGDPDDGVRAGTDEVFGVTAAAAIYRRSALEAVAVAGAVLPTEYFMYLDDVDLAWRLRLQGFRSLVDHAAIAWHSRALAGDADGARTGVDRIRSTIATESRRPDYVRERSWVNLILTLVRNDDPDAFLKQAPYMMVRRLPGDVFGLAQRPTMALAARLRLARLLPGALVARREIHARRVVDAREMARWLP